MFLGRDRRESVQERLRKEGASVLQKARPPGSSRLGSHDIHNRLTHYSAHDINSRLTQYSPRDINSRLTQKALNSKQHTRKLYRMFLGRDRRESVQERLREEGTSVLQNTGPVRLRAETQGSLHTIFTAVSHTHTIFASVSHNKP
jgi:hypothetical protein